MGETAEVVIVGGGAMGASVAWHLRELGITDVVLLERDSLASGSTAKSAGGIRAQFADELNVRIALRSLDEFERIEGIDLRQHGYLFLLDSDADVERFQAALALQHSLGVPSRELRHDRERRTGSSQPRTASSTATRLPRRSSSGTRAGSTCGRVAR